MNPVREENKHSEYDDWAWLYNQTVAEDYSKPQWQFLQRALLPKLAPKAKLLDLCCGSGQLICSLLDAGLEVTGLDGSKAMLDCAKKNAPTAKFVQADARTFELSETYDAVFSTSASLNHMSNIDELSQVFLQVQRCLKPDGIFVFDLNHQEQMTRWWQGRPFEGEVHNNFAWMITPSYDPLNHKGSFRVTAYRMPKLGPKSLMQPLKAALYRMLSKPRFIGLRLHLLQNFYKIEPKWERQDTDNPITGHDLDAVQQALSDSGFTDIHMETLDGDKNIDINHSAHFICRAAKTVEPSA